MDRLTRAIAHRYDPKYVARIAPSVARYADLLSARRGVTGLEHLFATQDDDATRIFVSRHISLGDPVVTGELFLGNGLRLPRVIGGDNLLQKGVTDPYITNHLPEPFSTLLDVAKETVGIVSGTGPALDLRRCGTIIIDRHRLKIGRIKDHDGKELLFPYDPHYTKAFASYFSSFLESGDDMLFYPEAGRNYDGRVKEVKGTLLSRVLSAAKRKESVLIPITLTYAITPEIDSFEAHRLFDEKRAEKEARILSSVHDPDKARRRLRERLGEKERRWMIYYDALLSYNQRCLHEQNEVWVDIGEPIPLTTELKKEELPAMIAQEYLCKTRVTPAALVAHALLSHETAPGEYLSRKRVEEHLSAAIGQAQAKGTLGTSGVMATKGGSEGLDKVIEQGVKALDHGERGSGVSRLGEGFRPSGKNGHRLHYYANSIRHFLDG